MSVHGPVTIATLRRLAREALGADADVADIDEPDYWSCSAATALTDVRGSGSTKQSARRQLRDLLQRLCRDVARGYQVGAADEERRRSKRAALGERR